MDGFKSYLAVALLLMGYSHAGWADQGPVVLRDNILSIPQAVVIEGDNISHFRNIELAQDADGSFSVAAAHDGSLANVESVEILRESDRVEVLTRGWRSACVSIEPEAVSYQDGVFVVAIPESEPTAEVCIAQAIEFSVTTSLDIEGLAPGQYTVVVNGVKAEFTL